MHSQQSDDVVIMCPKYQRKVAPVSEAQMAEQRRDALVNELFNKIIGAMEVATVYLGDRLGLYKALAEGGPATPAEPTGTHEDAVASGTIGSPGQVTTLLSEKGPQRRLRPPRFHAGFRDANATHAHYLVAHPY